MRRSQAPSVRRAVKRGIPLSEAAPPQPVRDPQEMQWGTAGGYKSLGPRKYGDSENPLKDKRIFLALWRNQSNKKHKTWTGNGTLEVTPTKVTLRDETNKVLDVLTCFKPEKIHENALLEIGLKDVEIQEELTTVEACIAQRNEEILNWCRKHEETDTPMTSAYEDIPRTMNMLKKPRQSTKSNVVQERITQQEDRGQLIKYNAGNPVSIPAMIDEESIKKEEIQESKLREYICLLEPAELQHLLLQLLHEYCQGLGDVNHTSHDILEITKAICDHPALLQHLSNQTIVSDILMPHLPSWQELGLYDSAKFEFLHLLLDSLVVDRGYKCAIVASSQECLDIIRGYCQCWEVPHIQIEDSSQAEYFNADKQMPLVALILANQTANFRLRSCKYMILYNYATRCKGMQLLDDAGEAQVYTLITADCAEERLFQQHLGLVQSNDMPVELLRPQVDATHKLLSSKDNILSSWEQWQSPFEPTFLKDTFHCDDLPSLSFVFSKTLESEYS